MRLETRNIHGGRQTDPETGATQFPLHLSSAFAYPDSAKLAAVFNGTEFGHVYSRISNPTITAFEQRLNTVESGMSTIAFASGMAAISAALLGLLSSGDTLVASTSLFGGTWSLLQEFLPRMGIRVVLVDSLDLNAVRNAIDANTRALFLESISNPGLAVADLEAWADIAKTANVPLVLDNTAMPGQLAAKKLGVAILVQSTTKWIDGHGRVIGGALTDTGAYKWRQAPHAHLAPWIAKAGPMAFVAYLRNRIVRDLGACATPFSSWLQASGLDTLQLRFDRHCDNTMALAGFLETHPHVTKVLYPGLASSPFHQRSLRLFGGRNHGAVLSVCVADQAKAWAVLDALKLVSRMTNLGDSRTLAIHVWSTINSSYSPEANHAMGVDPGLIRVSVGLENVQDLIEDFAQALAIAHPATHSGDKS